MVRGNFRHLVVLDGPSRLVGVVGQRDVVRALSLRLMDGAMQHERVAARV